MDGADRGDKVGLVDFARDAGYPDCGILSCALEIDVCTELDDRVTGADRVARGGDVERTGRVETLAGVKGEEAL